MNLISDIQTIQTFNTWDSVEKQNKNPFATKHFLAVEEGKLVVVERGFFGKMLITMGFSSSCMSKIELSPHDSSLKALRDGVTLAG